jgi:hypothetical protein
VSISFKGDAVSYFIVIGIYYFSIGWCSNDHPILIILKRMDMDHITRYIGMQVAASTATTQANTLPSSIDTSPSNVSTSTSIQSSSTLATPSSVSTTSNRPSNRQSQLSTSSTSNSSPPAHQRRIEDLLESSSDEDISDVKNDNDDDCMIVGTTPPPNRFSSQYSQSQPSVQRRRGGMFYCEHCESDTGCHNSVYGGFLEAKIGNTRKTGVMSENEVYTTILKTYKTICEFNSHNDILERKASAIVMLPYCMYAGTFKRCLTNHVVAAQHQSDCRNRADPSAQERFAHLNWVRARSEQVKVGKRKRKRTNYFD